MAKKSKSNGDRKKNADREVDLFAQLAATARSSRTLLSRQLLEVGLYAGQDSVILSLDANNGQPLSAIAAELGVRAPTMTKTISRLAAQGFVEKRESETDGRQSRVFLTTEGQEAVKAVRKAVKRSQKFATEGLVAKDIKTLAKLLKKIDQNLVAAIDT
ncbi:MarR family winged helix-turn-helix transcriptional regulator [Hoeflea sp. WL0058]|uniref:MarR family winged helix-turn-helix transcriptional regulator n=1 Tax=Flavimaribacter sediminis TaxID=2865987 RepID=A0AAE2ZNJ8_9HYPH|nr:MarR family winged helix-turn-helix transcriptional regulator [Flavimaribacter sediminis]